MKQHHAADEGQDILLHPAWPLDDNLSARDTIQITANGLPATLGTNPWALGTPGFCGGYILFLSQRRAHQALLVHATGPLDDICTYLHRC